MLLLSNRPCRPVAVQTDLRNMQVKRKGEEHAATDGGAPATGANNGGGAGEVVGYNFF